MALSGPDGAALATTAPNSDAPVRPTNIRRRWWGQAEDDAGVAEHVQAVGYPLEDSQRRDVLDVSHDGADLGLRHAKRNGHLGLADTGVLADQPQHASRIEVASGRGHRVPLPQRSRHLD
jgi:hypothetical protein